MGYEGGDDGVYPNLRKTLNDVAAHARGGVILFMTDALQKYLHMKNNLKKLPEYSRMTGEEKLNLTLCLRLTEQ